MLRAKVDILEDMVGVAMEANFPLSSDNSRAVKITSSACAKCGNRDTNHLPFDNFGNVTGRVLPSFLGATPYVSYQSVGHYLA